MGKATTGEGDYEAVMAAAREEGEGADGWTPPASVRGDEPPEIDDGPELPPAAENAKTERDQKGRFVAHTTADLPLGGEAAAKTPPPVAAAAPAVEPAKPPPPDPRLARLDQLEAFEAQARGFFQSPIWQQFQVWQQGPRPAPAAPPKPEPPPDDPIERVDWLTARLLTQEQRHAATERAMQEWATRAQELERQQGDIQRLQAERDVAAGDARIRAKYVHLDDSDIRSIMLQFSNPHDLRTLDQVADHYAAQQETHAKRWAAKQGLTRAVPPTAPRGAPPQAADVAEDMATFVKKLAHDDSPDGWTRGAHEIMRRSGGGR